MNKQNTIQSNLDKNDSQLEWKNRLKIRLMDNTTRILLALISVVSGLIGLGLRQPEIDELNRKIENQNQKIETQNERILSWESKVSKPSDKSFTLQEKLVDKNGKSLPYTEVYLIPATGRDHMTNTDAHGAFTSDNISSLSVWFIVKEKNQPSSRILIEPGQNLDIPVNEANIRYSLFKEQ